MIMSSGEEERCGSCPDRDTEEGRPKSKSVQTKPVKRYGSWRASTMSKNYSAPTTLRCLEYLKTSHEKLHLQRELASHLINGSLSRLMCAPNQNRSSRDKII